MAMGARVGCMHLPRSAPPARSCGCRCESTKIYDLDIPVTPEQLFANKSLTSGHWPYVVVGAMDNWPAMKEWAGMKGLDAINKIIPDEWVDYYPENMYHIGNKPYLRKFNDVVEEFKQPSKSGKPRYMQLRLGLDGWEKLEEKMYGPKGKLPRGMWTEKDWIYECMPERKDIDNFFRVNQWNMMLIGEPGTGIFFHHDHLSASSWQAHIVGRKIWTLCPYTQTHLLEPAGRIHTFDATEDEYPDFTRRSAGRSRRTRGTSCTTRRTGGTRPSASTAPPWASPASWSALRTTALTSTSRCTSSSARMLN